VIENRVDKYPIKVTVTATATAAGSTQEQNKTKIWSGKQQNLFSKYAAKRTKAIQEIVESLEKYRKETL